MKRFILALAAVLLSASLLSAQDLATATKIYNDGATALMSGNKTEALEKFQEALTMGEALGGDAEELVNNCKKAIPGVILSIGKELYNNKDLTAALEKFNQAADAAKDFAIEDVEKEAVDLIKQIEIQKIMEDANSARKTNNIPAAIEGYKKVLAADTTNGVAALYLGQLLSKGGDMKGAEEAFKHASYNGQARIANSQLSTLFLKRGAAMLKSGKFAEAIELVNKGNSFEENAQAYLVAGQANQKLGNNAEAIVAFEKYLDKMPNAKNAAAITFTVAALYQQAGNKAKAIENYRKVLTNAQFGVSAKQQIDVLSK